MENFDAFERVAATGQPWLEQLRREGIEQFRAVGFPSNKVEQWRHTNVAPIARMAFELGEGQAVSEAALAPFLFGAAAAAELVFINGHFSAEHSALKSLPAGVTVRSLAEMLRSDPGVLEGHLGQLADIEQNPFVALNTGFIQDGAFVYLAKGANFEAPIHLVFVSVAGATATVSHPRVLIVAEEQVRGTVVESYVGVGAGTYFTNAVTEITLGAGSELDHCRLQEELRQAFHISTTQALLAEKANLVSHSASLGGKLTRNDLNVLLKGERAHATLNGLVLIDGEQHCDNHTLLDHAAPNCPSHELYKHVLGGKASGVFRGKILVQREAQKTDSKQTSKSLLLSDEAYMNSQPALEIYADDVKCTHGSTTGPVDEDMIFYLRTRGVGLEAARHLLSYAFAADVTRRIRVEPVRRRLEDLMAARQGLPRDLRITDLGSHDEAAL
jgi:Fe-S cluster assembly protein SufD